MSTYSILKPPISGNCTIKKDEEPSEPLITLSTLKQIYDKDDTCLMQCVKNKLNHAIQQEDWDFDDFVEHDYSNPEILDCVIYYVTGYLSRQILKTVQCEKCKEAFVTSQCYSNNPVAKLTNLKTRGGLVHPNITFFYFIKSLEQLFLLHCTSSNVFELVLESALQANILFFPCSEHAYEIVPYCIQYFVRMRMRQYTAMLNKNQTKQNQLKKKQSKFCVT